MDLPPFGPQLVGETEKTLDALLRRELAPTGLTPGHWVALRLALQHAGAPAGTGLAEAVTARARLDDAPRLVHDLRAAALLDGDEVTPAGHDLVAGVQARVQGVVGPVLAAVPPADAAAAARALHALRVGVRQALDAPAT
ncbi:hypothetical protein ATJ88_0372 [Isoptericola jiangsuensis]|uniref:MarR family transcriptional regulator n=1 Tax=Isoptericola jiangsuensis TaxID=548579 RepID=A0A2A9ETW8_9MICO|nr:hypothetical protein [Isoptericola jiangsuensis]PFG41730.1 hypothetical protein ATJ88_0372 [Isoptericola jiangsuensis]